MVTSSVTSTSDAKPEPAQRWIGFDVIRLLSLIAITVHHFVWVMWYVPNISQIQWHWGWNFINSYARAISFSGHSVLFLSCLLIAKSESHPIKTLRVVAFVAAGWILFSFFEKDQNAVFWVWDIYPLIILGLLTALAVRQIGDKAVYALGLLGFILTWIPFWEFKAFDALSLQWRHWLVGDCSVDLADWPILPWVGFLWAPYALGIWIRNSELSGSRWWVKFHRFELVGWPVLLIAAVPQLGAYYRIILGSSFACYSFRQPPVVFWSHFIFIVFLLRISMLAKVQSTLFSSGIMRGISNLRLSRSFGLFYLVHYTLIETVAALWQAPISVSPHLSFLLFVAILPVTELLVRLLEAAFRFVINRRRSAPL
ncbi:MAG: hypothetical protein EOP06_06995 [Proteobacteria bacterium]|nr:MAG: hypothetical protein EOP06_06995 [Pseudomonadota bacterium]